ncbi:unnamed protein product [Lymnaea stagnalis]|uniref:E3 ubiquitin-protein ligase RNF10 n=1 Tax=Lymnaea stagnalis TaxID=6523 RepID=A0AAV2H8I2_LYMST
MLDEGICVMEKKSTARQSPVQSKNNGVISEKKSDFVSNKNGRQRRQRESNSAARQQELLQNVRPIFRSNRYFGDKRPRQRDNFNDRQSEEVAETGDIFEVGDTSSRKGNANHLLKFSYDTHGTWRTGGGRSHGYYKRSPAVRYSKEQFLQASCQFVVREDGEYSLQSIDPDALVNWDKVELVRTFSTETVKCPICLEVPFAGKITKCGHTYCWACILHHLSEAGSTGVKCPICPNKISPDELRSVQCIEVPEYKVGDEIEMKLMRKSKGSVYTSPKSEWKDRCGTPHNINDGDITNYMKILMASTDQVQAQVIDYEKEALDAHLLDAEDYETCFIEMAKSMLKLIRSLSKGHLESIGTANPMEEPATYKAQAPEIKSLPPDVALDGTKVSCISTEIIANNSDEIKNVPVELPLVDEILADNSPVTAENITSTAEESKSSEGLSFSQEVFESNLLSPEEAADYLELPEINNESLPQGNWNSRTKDTFYFYQASTGQHIYLHSLNAQCLTKEYGSLENSPEVIKASIIAIERIFMTEDVRKRLRYLNHIPLTCEFHVVELKIMPPVLSKEVLRHFQPEFDKRRRARQRKQKEDKMRAKQQDIEHKKSFGIYPEVQIPLDNLTQFPSHLSSSPSTGSVHFSEEDTIMSKAGSDVSVSVGNPWSNRTRNDSEGSLSGSGAMSFAAMLREGKTIPATNVWSRVSTPKSSTLFPSLTMPELRTSSSDHGGKDEDDEGEFLPAPPISASWFDDISRAMDANISRQHLNGKFKLPFESLFTEEAGASVKASGGKKKKKKQLLFSTTMARKN